MKAFLLRISWLKVLVLIMLSPQLTMNQAVFATVLSVGGQHGCAILPDDTVVCNGGGKIENVPNNQAFSQITGGYRYACGVKTNQSVACWLANPHSNTYEQATPPKGSFSQVSAGGYHTCGILTDNTVTCWGNNDYGQATPPPDTFSQISAGRWHTCGIRTDDTVACWGLNHEGQATPPSGTFLQVDAAMGGWHTCGVQTDNTLVCWGLDDHGQATPPSGQFYQVSAGKWFTCGIRIDRTLTCWGNNSDGQATPPSGTFSLLGAGLFHACGVRTNNTVVCWGSNGHGASGITGVVVKDSAPSSLCLLYGVHNDDLKNKTQFLTLDSDTFGVNPFGDPRKNRHIHALDIHPSTNQLYAAAGGTLYQYEVEQKTSTLTKLGGTGFKEIDGFTFHPDHTLWGWSPEGGLFKIKSQRNKPVLDKIEVVFPYNSQKIAEEEMEEQLEIKVTDLTWNTAGTTLYGVGKLSSWPISSDEKGTDEQDIPASPNWEVGQLWFYNPEENAVGTVCDKLMNSLTEVEALETRPQDDALLLGFHEKGKILLKMIKVKTCEIIEEKEISTEFSDIKGLAWPKNCANNSGN